MLMSGASSELAAPAVISMSVKGGTVSESHSVGQRGGGGGGEKESHLGECQCAVLLCEGKVTGHTALASCVHVRTR